jgi:hypothetical protein
MSAFKNMKAILKRRSDLLIDLVNDIRVKDHLYNEKAHNDRMGSEDNGDFARASEERHKAYERAMTQSNYVFPDRSTIVAEMEEEIAQLEKIFVVLSNPSFVAYSSEDVKTEVLFGTDEDLSDYFCQHGEKKIEVEQRIESYTISPVFNFDVEVTVTDGSVKAEDIDFDSMEESEEFVVEVTTQSGLDSEFSYESDAKEYVAELINEEGVSINNIEVTRKIKEEFRLDMEEPQTVVELEVN